jgi:hypothetical protein
MWPAIDNVLVRQALTYRKRGLGLPFTKHVTTSRLYSDFLRRLSIIEWDFCSQKFLERICEQVGAAALPTLERVNTTQVVGEVQTIDGGTSRLLRRLTSTDRRFLHQLSVDGVLPLRSSSDLALDFESTATRLGFRLG